MIRQSLCDHAQLEAIELHLANKYLPYDKSALNDSKMVRSLNFDACDELKNYIQDSSDSLKSNQL